MTLFNTIQPGGGNFSMPGNPFMRPPAQTPLNPQEEQSLLGSLGGKAMGGIQYVGGALEKAFGGRAIRGVLGGHPREALSVLPFSDTMGITDYKDRVSGEQLLEGAGLISKNDPNAWELRDFAGPAAEIALDPSTYLTLGGGALTASGQAAEKAGTLAPTTMGKIAAGHAGLVGLGLPFSKPSVVFGSGQAGIDAINAAGQAVKTVGNLPGIKQTITPAVHLAGQAAAPIYRAGRALFEPAVMGAHTPLGQDVAVGQYAAMPAAQAAARQRVLDAAKVLEQHGHLGADVPLAHQTEISNEIRGWIEGTQMGPVRPGVDEAAHMLQGDLRGYLRQQQSMGLPIRELSDPLYERQGINEIGRINHFPRYMTPLKRETKGFTGFNRRELAVGHPSMQGREEILKGLEGGTVGSVNPMTTDPRLVGQAGNPLRNVGADAAHVRSEYMGWSPQDEQTWAQLSVPGQRLTPAQKVIRDRLAEQATQSDSLVRWLGDLDPQHAAQGGSEGLPLFGNHVLTDASLYGHYAAKSTSNAAAIHELLAKAAIDANTAGPGAQPIADVLRKAGLTNLGSSASGGPIGALDEIAARMGIPVDQVKNFAIPAEHAADALRYTQAFQMPQALEPIVKAWDSFTNLMKGLTTSVFPSFHSRNALTGLWQNYVIGAHDPVLGAANPAAWVKPFQDAIAMRSGKPIEGIAAHMAGIDPAFHGLDDVAATQRLAEEMFVHGARVGGRHNIGGEAIGLSTHAERALDETKGMFKMPGREAAGNSMNPLDALANAVPRNWEQANPLNIAGVGGQSADKFAPVAAGRAAGAAVDDANRVSAYLAMRKQGFEPAAAAQKAKLAHYDYANLTPVERQLMRRSIPFYNWMRQNIPFTIQQLMEQPGGKVATALKLTTGARQKEGFLPEYIGEGLAVPMGQEADGNQRYMTGFGLPFENAFNDLSAGPDAASRTTQHVLSNLNPLLKYPLELAAGKQFFSGRELHDLYGPTGEPALDNLIMNSPAARAYTTGRTLMDERKDVLTKGFNLLGPGKVTDVDMEKQRALAIRDIIQKNLKENPHVRSFENIYVRPEEMANLSPEEMLMLRMYKTIEKQKPPAGGKIGVKK